MVSSKLLFEKVLKKVKPTKGDLDKRVQKFLDILNKNLKNLKLDAVAVVGGSVAKGTYLKDKHDCDIFVRFNYSYKDKNMSDLLEKVLKDYKYERIHGSRDYFLIVDKLKYELVPVLNIEDPKMAVNVTDMSPLHVKWVKKNEKYADDIRLAKQFCMSAGVYGAESYIKGISGHVLDILVIYYKGFEKFLAAAVKWKDKEVIDVEGYYKKDALKKLNSSKIVSPIIVIDPVLSERNAAAALSYEQLKVFQKRAGEFIKKPSEEFFKIKKKTITEIRKDASGNKLFLIQVKALEGKTDVVGAKLLKAYTMIKNQLVFHDFNLILSDWQWDKNLNALFWYVIDKKQLLPVTKWVGPPLIAKKNVAEFRSKHAKTFVDKGRVCSYVKRKYINSDDLINDIIEKDVLFKEKVKNTILR